MTRKLKRPFTLPGVRGSCRAEQAFALRKKAAILESRNLTKTMTQPRTPLAPPANSIYNCR
jgi:hypothetical protein